MESEMIVKGFRALGDTTRFQILELLSVQCGGGGHFTEAGNVESLTAGEICCKITGGQKVTSTISHHLHVLEDSGLLEISRVGKRAFCEVNRQMLIDISNKLQSIALQEPELLLFVCVHNSGRSQMAEAFVNHEASQLGLHVKGLSAGTVPGSRLNPAAVSVMSELGIDMSSQTPKILTQQLVDQSSKVITMGCGVNASTCPAKFIVSEDWGLDDPAGKDLNEVRRIRNDIRKKVINLLKDYRK